jgi:hypothetical protein
MSLKTIARPTRSSIEYNADAAGKDEMAGYRHGPQDNRFNAAGRAEAMAYRDARGQAMTDAD